jgi:hypothetical protein
MSTNIDKFICQHQLDTDQLKAIALGRYLELEPEVLLLSEEFTTNGNEFHYGTQTYLVLLEHELFEVLEKRLDSCIDDIMLHDIPKGLHDYFDEEKWKSTAKLKGAGHFIANYDGEEHKYYSGYQEFLIYRIN